MFNDIMDKHFIKHDVNSMKDSKILSLRKSFGMEGYGIFWSLLEILFNENGKLSESKLSDIAWELRVDETLIKSILDTDLFIKIEDYYTNKRIDETLNTVETRSKIATKAVNTRWEKHRSSITSGITDSNTICNTDKIREEKIREDKNNKPIGGFEKLLKVFPTTKVYSEHECLAIWDSLTQEEKQKVIKHSSVYVKELTKKNETQFMKNLKSYLASRMWENVSPSTKKKDFGRAMTKGGIDGKFVQWVSKQTERTFDESIKELALMSDEDYKEIRSMYEGETQNG